MKKDIPGYPGYKACEQGFVYSSRKPNIPMYMRLKTPSTDKNQKPRYQIDVRVDGKRKSCQVHRLVCLAFNGEPRPEQNECRHINGDPLDNRPENLAWGTRADNIIDSHRLGEYEQRAKLTKEQVVTLRRQYPFHVPNKAKEIGVHRVTLMNALSGRSWKHLDEESPPVRITRKQY